jgi:undecaprenyl-diphosphatase
VRASRAAALGVAQGVAEVVPVSSSAQLVLLPWLLGWEQPVDRTAFAATLHAGSCLGICWALRDDLRALTVRDVLVLGAVSAPAAVAGLVAADAVEQRLGRPPQLAALLAGFGALMWAVDARAPSRAAPGVTGRHAALAALAQVAALVPGVSRSGATLTALRAAGVDRATAERFTLLMSLPVTAGAAGLTLVRSRGAGARTAAPGAATAAVAAAAAASRLRARPARPLAGAALYRLGLAAVVARRLSRKGAR